MTAPRDAEDTTSQFSRLRACRSLAKYRAHDSISARCFLNRWHVLNDNVMQLLFQQGECDAEQPTRPGAR